MGLKWVVVFFLLDISIQRADANGVLNAQVFSVSSKLIIFKWDKVTGAFSYSITVDQKSNGQTKGFVTFNANTVLGSVLGLDPNVEYTYTIVANNATGFPVAPPESGDTFTAPEAMNDIVSVTPKDSTTVEVVFVPIAGVSKYVIRALNPADPTFISEDEVTSSPAEITGLQAYTEYQFSIMAANNAGKSQPTPSVTAKTLLPPPQIQSSSPNANTIELTWPAVTNAVEYTLSLLKYNANVTEKMTENTTSTNFTFSGLDPGALYLIEGYAWDAENRMGEISAESNQTTRPPAPGLVTVTAVTTNNQLGLSVSWTMDPDVYGEIHYRVSSNLGPTCNTTMTLTCELTPVLCGEVYTVEVIAENDPGPSVPSSSVSFTTVPCPPQNLDMTKTSPGSCNFTWDTVSHADGYRAYVKNADGLVKNCNTTGTSCDFTCECGYTYLMTVFAHNAAGLSQEGPVLNYTTKPCCPTLMNVSLVDTDTLEIEWVQARGAELYETRANDSMGVILCNDTAPVCALSYLNCDTPYSVKVIPCNDLSGCNHNCPVLTKETAACMPTALSLNKVDSSTVEACWSSSNRAATFQVTAKGEEGVLNCSTGVLCCNLTQLPCGSSYEVDVTATNIAGKSLPSYAVTYETEPCCPSSLVVKQVTQAMSNVSWSEAKGAHTFLTSLTSSKGHARCHTEDTHCIMGCITCGTNYTVTMEAHSVTGLKSNCSYQGFSSSLCCPSMVRIYRINHNELRVSWRSTSGASHVTQVNMTGYSNYVCTAQPDKNYCDLSQVNCGDEYTVAVLPVKADGNTEDFCPHRKYAVSCAGNHVGAILFRGKRSVE